MQPNTRKMWCTSGALIALGILPAVSAGAAEAAGQRVTLAQERLGPMSLALEPQIAYKTATVTIVGPDGYQVRKRFVAGAPIAVDLLADRTPVAGGQAWQQGRAIVAPATPEPAGLADGRYRYEAIFIDASEEAKVLSGLFFVEDGVAVSREALRARLAATGSELRDRQRREHTSEDALAKVTGALDINDNVTILDNAADGYTFLTLHSNAPPTPDEDWSWVNALGDLGLARDPGGADIATFFPNGDVGIGTTTPIARLHVRSSFNQLRLDDFQAAWRLSVFGGLGGFLNFIDNNEDVVVSFSHSAPAQRLVVTGGGVGIDTSVPQGNLHIFGAAGADVFSAVGPEPGPGGNALNFGYSGFTFGTGSGFFNVRPEGAPPNPALYFATGDVDRMLIDNQGFLGVHLDGVLGPGFNPAHPIHSQTSGAHLTAGGVWTNASSRELKEGITPLAAEAALTAFAKLEPVSFRYKLEPEDERVGFIAEEVPELVANPDRKTLSPMDVVAVLTRVVQAQQGIIDRHEKRAEEHELSIATLRARLEELERAVQP